MMGCSRQVTNTHEECCDCPRCVLTGEEVVPVVLSGPQAKKIILFSLMRSSLSGGSLNNMYAMVLARHKLKPEIKTQGLYCLGILVAFTSEDVS